MENAQQRYEIFVRSSNGFADSHLTATRWGWLRLNHEGLIIAHGTSHASLQACFAAARQHRSTFGHAPIKISLKDPSVPPAPDGVGPAVSDPQAPTRDVALAGIERVRLEGLQGHARARAAKAEHPAARTMHLRIADRYAAQIAAMAA